jgi:hypothetical protein
MLSLFINTTIILLIETIMFNDRDIVFVSGVIETRLGTLIQNVMVYFLNTHVHDCKSYTIPFYE